MPAWHVSQADGPTSGLNLPFGHATHVEFGREPVKPALHRHSDNFVDALAFVKEFAGHKIQAVDPVSRLEVYVPLGQTRQAVSPVSLAAEPRGQLAQLEPSVSDEAE